MWWWWRPVCPAADGLGDARDDGGDSPAAGGAGAGPEPGTGAGGSGGDGAAALLPLLATALVLVRTRLGSCTNRNGQNRLCRWRWCWLPWPGEAGAPPLAIAPVPAGGKVQTRWKALKRGTPPFASGGKTKGHRGSQPVALLWGEMPGAKGGFRRASYGGPHNKMRPIFWLCSTTGERVQRHYPLPVEDLLQYLSPPVEDLLRHPQPPAKNPRWQSAAPATCCKGRNKLRHDFLRLADATGSSVVLLPVLLWRRSGGSALWWKPP
ncbi:hypothetical protein ICNINCKA_01273 [Synechococcus sp. CBW1107]|nr:hypothetical protein ICNINCKA_01273 [Synechococcus sp. CBW1107]